MVGLAGVPLPRSPRREPEGVPPTKGSRWERLAQYVVARDSGICWLCLSGHGGARQADHVISYADRPDLAWRAENIKAAHGAPGNPCPVCTPECGRRVFCNQLRQAMSVERFRRILAEMRAAHAAGKGAPQQDRPKPESQAGREWLPHEMEPAVFSAGLAGVTGITERLKTIWESLFD